MTVKPIERNTKALLALAALLAVACLSPGVAQASFTRPFLRQISRAANPSTTPCSEAQVKAGPPCVSPSGGIAVDSSNDVWVGDGNDGGLDEFSPAYAPEPNAFVKTLPIEAQAIQSANTNDFYKIARSAPGSQFQSDVEVFSPTGAHLETWGQFYNPTIAIDNATEPLTDPSACGTMPLLSSEECFVYVFDDNGGVGNSGGLEKFSSKGVPVEFANAKKCEAEKCGYIEGNKITVAPPSADCAGGELSQGGHETPPVAVDAEGDIYLLPNSCNKVLEFRPNGEFRQAFNPESEEVPRVEGKISDPIGLAVDPVSGHLLVSTDLGPVDEFEPATGRFVTQITETSEGTPLPPSLVPVGVTVDSHSDVYVVERGLRLVDVWGPGAYLPTLTLAAASERKGESAALEGTVNPEGLRLSQCQFQYVSEEEYEKEGFLKPASSECSPAASAITVENKENEVKAQIGGLTPGTTYRYRLVASSEGALGGTVDSEPLAFTAPAPPVVLSTSASNLSSTFADLHAQIDPAGAATTYHFEYLTAAAFAADGESFSGPDPATSAPVPDASIGLGGPLGNAGESVLQHVGPLVPSTTYYYRVVARNAQGVTAEAVCEGKPAGECTFVTLPAAVPGLPDGRAYEIVTPVDKEGGSDMFAEERLNGEFGHTQATGVPARSGNGFLLEADSLFGPYPGSYFATYVFRRDPAKGEWTYTALVEPSLGVQSALYTVFEPENFSRVAFNDNVGSEIGTGQQETSLVGPLGGPYTTLHVDPTAHKEATLLSAPLTRIVGASHDLSHVLIESNTAEGKTNIGCPGSAQIKHGHALCEWAGGYETTESDEVKPELRLVDVDSVGEPVNTCGALLGNEGDGGTHQAVSADGSRVFFTAPDPRGGAGAAGPGCWQSADTSVGPSVPGGNAPQVYARIDATSTLELSAPEPGLTEAGSTEPHERPAPYSTTFVGASEDGSKVFFVTDAWLTANHPQVHDPELYECEIVEEVREEKTTPKCRLTRISAGVQGEPGESEGAELFKVEAVANEGDAVYYTAFGALAPGASKLEGHKETNSDAPVNLYRYQPQTATTAAQTSYVATVSTNDMDGQPECGTATSNEANPCTGESWYTTPDGRYLLFYSELDLTANAHAGGHCAVPEAGDGAAGPCGMLYRYDAQATEAHEPSLVCVSCDRNGGVTSGNARFTRAFPANRADAPVDGMSNDGSYVFFDTTTPLVPQATNGTLNVYEWHEGTISLINSGAEAGPSYFLGYSPYVTPGGETIEGGNVFFGTHQKLVAADTNRVGNIYDARVCVAESPCIQPPPGETAQCEGASCQAQPAEPLDATPTSLSFSGPGDVSSEASSPAKAVTKRTAAKCKEGYVKKKMKRKTECVKKPEKRAKKSSHGKGSH